MNAAIISVSPFFSELVGVRLSFFQRLALEAGPNDAMRNIIKVLPNDGRAGNYLGAGADKRKSSDGNLNQTAGSWGGLGRSGGRRRSWTWSGRDGFTGSK